MKLRIEHNIDLECLIWCCASVIRHGGKKKLTKGRVLSYLKTQVAQFGDDEASLCGEDWRSAWGHLVPMKDGATTYESMGTELASRLFPEEFTSKIDSED